MSEGLTSTQRWAEFTDNNDTVQPFNLEPDSDDTDVSVTLQRDHSVCCLLCSTKKNKITDTALISRSDSITAISENQLDVME